MLKLKKCTLKFGELTAVSELDFEIKPNELVGIIGPNGAGKTTVFNLITGVYQPTSGQILFQDQAISKLKSHQIACLGIARTFQNIRLFKDMSVYDNIRVSLIQKMRSNFWQSISQTQKFQTEEKEIAKTIHELFALFHLEHFKNKNALDLPYGVQRKVELIRALATKPKLLLLDEPAAGMHANEKIDLMNLIQKIKEKFNLAILLIEHDMNVIMGICERIAVLDYGVKIAEGNPQKIKNDPAVIAAYLGDSIC